MAEVDAVLFKPGTTVEIGPKSDPITADVLAVSLRGRNVQYEVVWWLNGRQEAWLSDCEVRARSGTRTVKIGFHGKEVR